MAEGLLHSCFHTVDYFYLQEYLFIFIYNCSCVLSQRVIIKEAINKTKGISGSANACGEFREGRDESPIVVGEHLGKPRKEGGSFRWTRVFVILRGHTVYQCYFISGGCGVSWHRRLLENSSNWRVYLKCILE